MPVLAEILPLVSRASTLALKLYRHAATAPKAAKDIKKIAKSISEFGSILKHVGTIIKEDDRLPSSEAIEILQDVIEQSTAILDEIGSTVPVHDVSTIMREDGYGTNQSQALAISSVALSRLAYLVAHLDSLRLSLSVMLQALYTAQSIMWARSRAAVSPQQAAAAVANEKNHLETLIIEQQMSILSTSVIYQPLSPDAGLLMENDSARSVVAAESTRLRPANLFHHQDTFIASLDTSNTAESDWLSAVCRISRSQLERILERWTRLHQFEESLRDEERIVAAQRRESQQPSVESDSDDGFGQPPKFTNNGERVSTPTPRRPGNAQPLFTETNPLQTPVSESRFGPTAPLSPASSHGTSPGSSGYSFIGNTQRGSPPVSPRSSTTSLPVEAAAAVEAKDLDEDVDLEIPWTLCTRTHYWKYIDSKVKDSDTEAPSSVAYSDRNSWTEILASWVCKEAIKEAGYKFTQVSKPQQEVRRTKLETCFCIQQPLTFDQVKRLVERTVDIYRRNRPASPPTRSNRSSIDRPLQLNLSHTPHDREKTPVAKKQPLERSTTSYPLPPPPPLDRSMSLPGAVPTYAPNPHASRLHLQMPQVPHSPQAPQGSYSPQAPQSPYSPQAIQVPFPSPLSQLSYPPQVPQNPYSPHASSYPPRPTSLSSQLYPPGTAPFSPSLQPIASDPRFLPNNLQAPSPLRQSHHSRSEYFSSDSDSATRSRKHRSKSRQPAKSYKKKGHSSAALGTLVGVGGLTALLDGLAGL